MIFRQLFDDETSTYTYLVADEATGDAALVDPVFEHVDDYLALLTELGLKLRWVLDTHVHADHVTGAGLLRERTGARTVVGEGANIACADVHARHGQVFEVGGITLEARLTPGHTNADVVYVMSDRVFTGDTLFVGGCGRTDFQHGDAGRLYDGLHANVFSLPGDTLVYPGHDYHGNTVTTVKQELAKNPRLGGGRTREDFVKLMGALDLPYPKHIDRALPANLACGIAPQG